MAKCWALHFWKSIFRRFECSRKDEGSRVKSVSKYWLHIVFIVSEERGWHFRCAGRATKVLCASMSCRHTCWWFRNCCKWWDKLISNLNCFSPQNPQISVHATVTQNFDGSEIPSNQLRFIESLQDWGDWIGEILQSPTGFHSLAFFFFKSGKAFVCPEMIWCLVFLEFNLNRTGTVVRMVKEYLCICMYTYNRLNKLIESTLFLLWHVTLTLNQCFHLCMKRADSNILATPIPVRFIFSFCGPSCQIPHDSSHGPRQDFKCRRPHTNNNSHSRFACFYLCVTLRFGVSYPQINGTERTVRSSSNVWHWNEFGHSTLEVSMTSRPRILGSYQMNRSYKGRICRIKLEDFSALFAFGQLGWAL